MSKEVSSLGGGTLDGSRDNSGFKGGSDEDDNSSKSSSRSSRAWISKLEFCFPVPTMFPYHESSGCSVVAGYNTSPSGTGCPSDSDGCSSSKTSGGGGQSNSNSSATNSTSVASEGIGPRMDDLEFSELLQALHEDYLKTSRRSSSPMKTIATGREKSVDDTAKEMAKLDLQVQLLLQVGDCHEPSHLQAMADVYEKIAGLSHSMGDTDNARQALQVTLRLRQSIHKITTQSPANNISLAQQQATAIQLVHTQQRMGDFLLQHAGDYEGAMQNYQAALDLLDRSSFCAKDISIAACLYGIGSTLLQACELEPDSPTIEKAIELLTNAVRIRQSMMVDDHVVDENGCIAVAEILLAMGDASRRQAHGGSRALECYQAALEAVSSTKLDDSHELKTGIMMALADFYCSSNTRTSEDMGRTELENQKKALYYYGKVQSDSIHHEPALLKMAILHFDRGDIESALRNLTGFLEVRNEIGQQHDLDYFMGLLSTAACHYVNGNALGARKAYEEAHRLLDFPDNQLLVENPTLETYLWNFMVEGLLPFERVIAQASIPRSKRVDGR